MSLDLNKLKKRVPLERSKKKTDRYDGLSEKELEKYMLEDYLEMNLDIVFVGINPSLMAAHRGRYYAGPGNHFYKLLHESGLTPRCISFEEDYKLLQYGIGLTNIVTRPTRSAADLKRAEIKEGTGIVEEKLKIYKPKIAVFNGKCIYEVFANLNSKSTFYFGLQPERIGETAIWVTPSSSARCAHFPRMVDKLHFYTALKKYLDFLKGEITDVDVEEFQFEGKCKQSVASTSKMWRRKTMSTFLHGGRVVNKNTLCLDTSEEDIAAVRTTGFLLESLNHESHNKNKDMTKNEETHRVQSENRTLFNKPAEKTETNTMKIENFATPDTITGDIIVETMNKEISDVDKNQDCSAISNNTLSQESTIHCKKNRKCKSSRITPRIVDIRSTLKNKNKSESLDFISLIKQRLSQKTNDDDAIISA
ncbi:G/T mismatch-specific thymine DNA glycosylase-like [Pseudomyrmex gracilis]|uniref:G/T mismatch-specific thymine DNA glycosylase-like n=1 Tax=Pseudomyrmex gracilis TaxID=219809 RepID=UPI000995A26F|nr:G/T mismatch-specific thymine DNA glycosylase-like [Pseudomyrmex gracilis]